MLEDGKIVWGLLYPEPGNVSLYTLEQFHADYKSYRGVKLKWACPTSAWSGARICAVCSLYASSDLTSAVMW